MRGNLIAPGYIQMRICRWYWCHNKWEKKSFEGTTAKANCSRSGLTVTPREAAIERRCPRVLERKRYWNKPTQLCLRMQFSRMVYLIILFWKNRKYRTIKLSYTETQRTQNIALLQIALNSILGNTIWLCVYDRHKSKDEKPVLFAQCITQESEHNLCRPFNKMSCYPPFCVLLCSNPFGWLLCPQR